MSRRTFSTGPLERVRRRIARMFESDRETAEGWSKSDIDPMAVLALFPDIRIRPGFVLRAYRFVQGGNGNGIVWAMPIDAPFPEPGDCEPVEDTFLQPPRPRDALSSFASVLEPIGTARSYLSASILVRELGEFGAMWHGLDWGTHRIFDGWPVGDEDCSPESLWEWQEPRPADFRPAVELAAGGATVTFHTLTGLGEEAIFRHVDRHRIGSCEFANDSTQVATGPGGYLH